MRNNRFEIFSTSVSQLIKSVQSLKSKKMAQYGLKGTNALCLCQILESGSGLTATELARQGEIDKAQVSRCVAELMERGFVYRDDRDGRRYKQKYRLTPEGLVVATDIHNTVDDIQKTIHKDVTPEELDAFYRTLYKLCENFNELLEKQP